MESNRRLSLPPSVSLGLGLFIAALILRLMGIDWGLPGPLRITSLHPDEPINWMVTRQAADLTPNFYNYGTLFFSINNLFLSVIHSLGLGAPDPQSATVAGLAQEFLAGRFVSALAGATMVWTTFAFLFKRVNWVGALAGACAVLFSPGLVVHSRFMTVDVMASCFILLSLFWAGEALEREDLKPYILAGLFAGLAAGAKYNGILALAAIAPAIWHSPSGERLKRVAAATGTALIVFLLAVPGVLLEREAFLRDFGYEMWHTSAGHGLVFAGTSPGFIFHWTNLFIALGFLLTCMGVVGLARLVQKKTLWAFAILAFFVLYFVLIARAEVKFMRYVLPLVPILAIGFGWLMGRMQEHPNRKKWSWGVALGICAIGGLGRGGVADSATMTAYMMGQDPRDSASEYLRGKESVGVVSDPWFYTPSFYPEVPAPRPVPFAQREAWRLASSSPRVLRFVPSNPDERLDWDVRLLTDLKPEYVEFGSFEREGYERLVKVPTDSPEKTRYSAFALVLQRDYALEIVFGGGLPDVHDLLYIRPEIQIWKRKSTNSSITSPPSVAPATTP